MQNWIPVISQVSLPAPWVLIYSLRKTLNLLPFAQSNPLDQNKHGLDPIAQARPILDTQWTSDSSKNLY